jgi:hypothetical protein
VYPQEIFLSGHTKALYNFTIQEHHTKKCYQVGKRKKLMKSVKGSQFYFMILFYASSVWNLTAKNLIISFIQFYLRNRLANSMNNP